MHEVLENNKAGIHLSHGQASDWYGSILFNDVKN